MEWTRKRPYFWHITSKCGLDLGGADLVLGHDTPIYSGWDHSAKYFQNPSIVIDIILPNNFKEWQSYGTNRKKDPNIRHITSKNNLNLGGADLVLARGSDFSRIISISIQEWQSYRAGTICDVKVPKAKHQNFSQTTMCVCEGETMMCYLKSQWQRVIACVPGTDRLWFQI